MSQTNSARRREQQSAAQAKAAELREAQRRKTRRQRLLIIGGSVVGFLALVAVMVVVGASSGSQKQPSERPLTAASVIAAVSAVPSRTIDAVGVGTTTAGPRTTNGDAALTSGGKPEVLFIGAEFCPYCAAERWALVQALSRFGTFSDLKSIKSSSRDVFPSTATFSFYGSTYTSKYLTLVTRENADVNGKALEATTAAENALWQKYTGNPSSYPFADLGGKHYLAGPSFDAGVLKGLSDEQIAARLSDPDDAVSKAVVGAANEITAALCTVVKDAPAEVCRAPGVVVAAASLS